MSHPVKFTDNTKWAIDHDKELRKLERANFIYRNTTEPPGLTPIQLTMVYSYNWNPYGTVIDLKSRCSLLGDLMRPNVQYAPHQTKCPTADKTTARLLFVLPAAHG